MPKRFRCRQPHFVIPNPDYDENEEDWNKQSHYKYRQIKATDEEAMIVVNYATAVFKNETKGKKFEELEQLYQKRIVDKKKIGSKPAKYTQCGSGDTRRVYVRSDPKGEPGPKIVKKKWGTGFGGDLIHDVRVRRRQFVPFGLYCNSCDTLMQNERYRALDVEERKIKVFMSSPDEIVQGHDNHGYFKRELRYSSI